MAYDANWGTEGKTSPKNVAASPSQLAYLLPISLTISGFESPSLAPFLFSRFCQRLRGALCSYLPGPQIVLNTRRVLLFV